ncbi:MAG: cation-transporting P-type ATPase [Geminicoccaceae bacterium]|nr:cation-transporting P-type ATPase [Geminicoccaceae bacterium]MCS7267550.1 cation-transporting P-type ATPase [Geminicoccaceae bacterium]MDW8124564.1 cation-transporting P-type ATPase [Geminicoccaceae bacterium]MDW8341082.1 cation-transporting P-type ATPase [Geminicoccaceae bacterium]
MELSTLVGQEPEEVLESLGSSAEGLDPEEAARRLARFGPNRLEARARPPALSRLLATLTHFFALLLWAAAALAWIGHRFDPEAGLDTLAVAIVAVVLVNGVFAFAQEYRAERMLAALARLLPARARVLRGGRLEEVPIETLVPGDVILLEAGDLIPADARLVVANALRVDLATLTGEARPRPRSAAPAPFLSPLEAPNLVLAGTTVVAGEGRAVVFATGHQTEFGRIVALVQAEPEPRSLFLAEIARASRWIAAVACTLGAVFLLAGLSVGLSASAAAVFALGVIVANVPEGLLPTVTLALAMAAQRLARRGVLVRHLPAIETLGAASVIVTDKTGTLTTGAMVVRVVQPADAAEPVPVAALDPREPVIRRLLEVAASCHGLVPGPRGLVGDPMERALVEAAGAHGIAPLPVLSTIPFDADRKRMGTIHDRAGERLLFCKGAPETVLARCTRIAAADGPAPLGADARARLLASAASCAERGYRLLALAYRPLAPEETPEDENELVFTGFVGFEDPPRPGAAEAVATARRAGIRVIVATGDHPLTALALARRIGLVRSQRPRVITGDRLARLSNAELQLALDAEEILFARLAADQKLRLVKALQARGETVAVTGDGVNDAPALKRAEIGVAMGRSGSDVAREAADIVLIDDDFAAIVAAIAEGRAVFANVRRFLTYILASNVPELVPFLLFALLGVPLPLTVVQILAVDLGTDLLPALALGAEPPAPDTMERPPRAKTAALLDRGLFVRAYLWLGILETLGSLSAYAVVLWLGGWRWDTPLSPVDPLRLEATSATLTGIVLAQMANLFVCRHERIASFAPELPRNPLILPALLSEAGLLLAILFTSPGRALFGTAPPAPAAWLVGAAGAVLLFCAEEARKALSRRREGAARLRTRDR